MPGRRVSRSSPSGIVAAVFAFGTLVYTVTALSLAPQVVMFVGLTHATIGLDHVRPGGDHDPAIARARPSPVPRRDPPDVARDRRRVARAGR